MSAAMSSVAKQTATSSSARTRETADLTTGATPALTIRIEPDVDYVATASLADQGFGARPGTFRPERLRWLYEIAFSQGSTVVGVFAGDKKVGQVVLIHQAVSVDGRLEAAVSLVDLFILKEFRSRQAMADLYGEVERHCVASGIRFILAVPNGNGTRVNMRYLKLTDLMRLDIRIGAARPWRGGGVRVSAALSGLGQEAALALFAEFLPSEDVGLFWTGPSLWTRFDDPRARYGVHVGKNLLLISAPRLSRGLPHTLICAMLAKPGAEVRLQEVRSLVRAACALHRRSLFVYAGLNRDVPLPGWSLPERLRPSAMVVQSRDFQSSGTPMTMSRFELLDFDFA